MASSYQFSLDLRLLVLQGMMDPDIRKQILEAVEEGLTMVTSNQRVDTKDRLGNINLSDDQDNPRWFSIFSAVDRDTGCFRRPSSKRTANRIILRMKDQNAHQDKDAPAQSDEAKRMQNIRALQDAIENNPEQAAKVRETLNAMKQRPTQMNLGMEEPSAKTAISSAASCFAAASARAPKVQEAVASAMEEPEGHFVEEVHGYEEELPEELRGLL